MALYAANNISSAVRNFEDRSYARIFGIVLNHRNVENETEKVQAFAENGRNPDRRGDTEKRRDHPLGRPGQNSDRGRFRVRDQQEIF